MDPSPWWDHSSEKVTEHQSCQSSHVNGAIAIVGVNLVALSINSFQILCTGGIVVVGWRR